MFKKLSKTVSILSLLINCTTVKTQTPSNQLIMMVQSTLSRYLASKRLINRLTSHLILIIETRSKESPQLNSVQRWFMGMFAL